MGETVTNAIEAWFGGNRDGEFISGADAAPYSVIGAATECGRIIYATKPPLAASAIEGCPRCSQFGMIARCGLPGKADLRWIRTVIGKAELWFLGDMDPADLMIFAWLRRRLRPKRIKYLGISDAYLAALQLVLPESSIMFCSESERRSFSMQATAFPDLRETVGPKCMSFLEHGRKIELEAIVSAQQTTALLLLPIFTFESD